MGQFHPHDFFDPVESREMIPKTMKACMLTAFNTFEIRELPVPREAGKF